MQIPAKPFDENMVYFDSNTTQWQIKSETLLVCDFSDGHTLFRRAVQNEPEWTYYLLDPLSRAALEEPSPPDKMTNAIETGAYGRCIGYIVEEAQEADVLLFFSPDSTGFYQDWDEQVLFVWSAPEQGMSSPHDILTWPVENLWSLCHRVFHEQVWPMMKDPYLRVGEDINDHADPIEFICGSEAELRRVTRWICYTEPGFFDTPGNKPVTYEADTSDEEGGLYEYWSGNPSERLQTLCALAFEYNAFTGFGYEYNDQNGHRHSGYSQRPATIRVEPDPPSAHERIEAFLELSGWLNGKVTPGEKNELLGLSQKGNGNL